MTILHPEQLRLIEGNKFLGKEPTLINSQINFHGKNNILICEEGVVLQDSVVDFRADNSIIYLSQSAIPYIVKIIAFSNSVCFIGRHNYFNEKLTLILSEEKNIIIGNHCCLSFGIWMRTADPHLIYNIADNQRINHSRSIYVGDHVWIGQNAMVLKGSSIHSGSVIGAMSLVAGKTIHSNSCWGGNPVKMLKENIAWSGESVHHWTEATTRAWNMCDTESVQFNHDDHVLNIAVIEQGFKDASNVVDKCQYLLKHIVKSENKNRFYG